MNDLGSRTVPWLMFVFCVVYFLSLGFVINHITLTQIPNIHCGLDGFCRFQ